MRYGGNTSCVEYRSGNDVIILDAGTGLRKLGQALLQEFSSGAMNLTLLLSHTHWDHIQGLPFFAPIYESRCRLRIIGCEGSRKTLVEALTGQMETTYFPVPFSQLPSNIEIEELQDFTFDIGNTIVRAKRANHPGVTVGYRLFSPDGVVCFFPDVEPRSGGHQKDLVEFVKDADLLLLDSQYDSEEYRRHVGWGHGCVRDSVALAVEANAKRLLMFHHDPDHTDARIDELVKAGRDFATEAKSSLVVDAAMEGSTILLSPGSKV